MLAIRDGELQLLRAGSAERISAETAFQLLTQKTSVVQREPQVEELSVHEAREAIRLVIRRSATGAIPFESVLSLQLDGRHTELPKNWIPQADHIVIGKDWYALDAASIDAIKGLQARCEGSINGKLTIGQLLRLRSDRKNSWVLDDTEALLSSAESIIPASESEPLDGHGIKLYPYQQQGLRWLMALVQQGVGGVLADEMGLGKTVQIIALMKTLGSAERLQALVVGPTSILENWRREIAQFSPELRVLVHRGGQRTGRPRDLMDYDVVVCSYDTAVRDEVLLRGIEWTIVVCDEAQALKNPDTSRSQVMKRMKRRTSIAVTGTPLENRILDLWSVFDFANEGLLGDRAPFEKEINEQVLDFIAEQTAPLILRRRTAAVAKDLPALVDIPHFIALTDAEASAYEAIRNASDSHPRSRLGDLAKLQQFCSHPALVYKESWQSTDCSKMERARELVEEIYAFGEKVLVFAAYTQIIAWLREQLAEHLNVPSWEITGAIAPEMRQSVVDDFSRHNGSALLVLNPRAGGVGLNITAANHVIHYSAEWNPAVIDQATKRAHRRGQQRPVTVHRLLVAGTVDEVVNERLKRKRDLAERAVQGTTAEDLSTDDLLKVFALSPMGIGSV